MRIKITISVQKAELEIIDRRAKELKLTRSAYLKALVLKDIEKNNKEKKRVTDFR